MNKTQLFKHIPQLKNLIENADVVDIKTIQTQTELRTFIAGMLSYSPRWLTILYGIRWFFVRLLGMKQEGIPTGKQLLPADISMTPGNVSMKPSDVASIFQVTMADEPYYWVAEAAEKHLIAQIGTIAINGGYVVLTLVHYQHWTGPLYFNVIRPFHHLVVRQMMKAGAKHQPTRNGPTQIRVNSR